jgi:hypothetical protein
MSVGDGWGEAYTTSAWGAGLSHEIRDDAEAETFRFVEGNMCGSAATRGPDALPGSETVSRAQGTRRNLGDLRPGRATEHAKEGAQAAAVRIGKARSRSR